MWEHGPTCRGSVRACPTPAAQKHQVCQQQPHLRRLLLQSTSQPVAPATDPLIHRADDLKARPQPTPYCPQPTPTAQLSAPPFLARSPFLITQPWEPFSLPLSRHRPPTTTTTAAPPPPSPRDAPDPNELFAQVVYISALSGFAADIAPAAGTCKAVWEDGRTWELLLRVPRFPVRGPRKGEWVPAPTPLDCALEAAKAAADADPSGATSPPAARALWLVQHGAHPNATGPSLIPPLHYALVLRDAALLAALLERGADPNAAAPWPYSPACYYSSSPRRTYPLEVALDARDAAATLALLAAGAGTHVSGGGRPPLLHQAATALPDPAVAAALIQGGCGVHVRCREGTTALHAASTAGHAEVVTLLLSHGARIDEPTADLATATPLELAMQGGREEASLTLLRAGAAIPAFWGLKRHDNMEPPLVTACRARMPSVAAELLQRRGADANARQHGDPGGHTALHVAARLGRPDLIALLLAHGADVHAVATHGDGAPPDNKRYWSSDASGPAGATPLLHAAHAGCQEGVALLLSAGATLTATCAGGLQALAWACRCPHSRAIAVVRLLLEAGADPWARCAAGRTSLHWAVREGAPETVTFLLGLPGADDVLNPTPHPAPDGAPPRSASLLEAVFELPGWNASRPPAIAASICHQLLRRGAHPTRPALAMAAKLGLDDVVREMLRLGADVRAAPDERDTLLHAACSSSTIDASVVAALIEAGASVNGPPEPVDREVPLYAALSARPDLALLLLEAGASATPLPLKEGMHTTLHVAAVAAAHNERYDGELTPALVAALVRGGADPNARAPDGRTPLHVALPMDTGHLRDDGTDDDAAFESPLNRRVAAMAGALVDAGADPAVQVGTRMSPLLWAVVERRGAAVAAMLRRRADARAVVDVEGGDTLLHFAARVPGSARVIRTLIERGASPTARNGGAGWTPLVVALHRRLLGNVRALLEWGGPAQLSVRGLEVECPLHFALLSPLYPDGAAALVAAGASVTLRCCGAPAAVEMVCHRQFRRDWAGLVPRREIDALTAVVREAAARAIAAAKAGAGAGAGVAPG